MRHPIRLLPLAGALLLLLAPAFAGKEEGSAPPDPEVARKKSLSALEAARKGLAAAEEKRKAFGEEEKRILADATATARKSANWRATEASLVASTKLLFAAAALEVHASDAEREARAALLRSMAETARDLCGAMKGEPCPAGCCEFKTPADATPEEILEAVEAILAEGGEAETAVKKLVEAAGEEEEEEDPRIGEAMMVVIERSPAYAAATPAFDAIHGGFAPVAALGVPGKAGGKPAPMLEARDRCVAKAAAVLGLFAPPAPGEAEVPPEEGESAPEGGD